MNWFAGSTFKIWWEFLKSNKQLWYPKNWIRILLTSIFTLRNSKISKKENKLISDVNFNSIQIQDPIFILGHWRSGTTHLHNILINDSDFNYPTLLQVTFPNTFLMIQKKVELKKQRPNERPMDNMQITYNSPSEEEVAVWTMCNISSIGNRLVKDKEGYYDKFLTFSDASENEYNVWKENLTYFLKKVSLNDNRRLLLKSPESTARINLLLELFPNAKFINIHRNPFDVYKSTKNLYKKVFKPSYFHKVSNKHLEERIFKVYKNMHEAYFKSVDLIPENNFMDISYEDLINNPMKTIQSIYKDLCMELTDNTQKKMEIYLDSVNDYKKNEYSKTGEELVNKIFSEWEMCFKSWNYDIED